MLTRRSEVDNRGVSYAGSTFDIPHYHDELAARIKTTLAANAPDVALQAHEAYRTVVDFLDEFNRRFENGAGSPDTAIENVILAAFPPDTAPTPAQASLVRALRSMWMILTDNQRGRWSHLVVCQDEQTFLLGDDREKLFAQLTTELAECERDPGRYAQQGLGRIHRLMRIVLDSGRTDNRLSDEYADKLRALGWESTVLSDGDDEKIAFSIGKGLVFVTTPINRYSKQEIQDFLAERADTARQYGKSDVVHDDEY